MRGVAPMPSGGGTLGTTHRNHVPAEAHFAAEKEKGRKLVEASGLICGAGAGIEIQAVGLMNARFLYFAFEKYHQKYHHFQKCPVCGFNHTVYRDAGLVGCRSPIQGCLRHGLMDVQPASRMLCHVI